MKTPCICYISYFCLLNKSHWVSCLYVFMSLLRQEAYGRQNRRDRMTRGKFWRISCYMWLSELCLHLPLALAIENFLNKATSLQWVSILIIISLIKTRNVNIFYLYCRTMQISMVIIGPSYTYMLNTEKWQIKWDVVLWTKKIKFW